MRLIAAFAACMVIAFPSLSRAQEVNGVKYPDMLDYGVWPKSKVIEIDGHKFRIWFHSHKPFIMIQPTILGSMSGATFSHMDLAYWEDAAQGIVEPYGCKITDVAPKTKMGATWNAQYLCPDGKIINPSDAVALGR
jgi:hypothetical protein